jgi:hypothetical protein
MEKSEILGSITNSVSEKLKVPIILTYICVLIIFNWDILFYLFFENSAASTRISTIKEVYGHVYYERIIICLSISVLLIVLFAILNTFLNLALKWFYRKDKEITSEIENFEKISFLTEQLSESIEDSKRLSSEVAYLKNINENLTSKNLDIDLDDISKNDFNMLLSQINSQGNKKKLLYSLKELINSINKDNAIESDEIFKIATYESDMKNLIEILKNRELLKITENFNPQNHKSTMEFKLSRSFEDFLKMKI